ncbi:MAG: extracellular solute-binding protein [Rhizobiales bacterium]|nr:extracellular solute-binding protein [Hyphomicrobiales bacterium]MBO6698524.1 extracellular solute-binding protein [Hyphomicrobiales bacterium]MBO6735222.1 extracellular solute-binding protein [Hyphomicrobiales bacterium]MBO6910970.1 extracellular solute-binding protein [Hyphomicrobiales bacterium]MBO6956013.1 extracellular solute-binding protein [Hyphomicrobiales bacterium]
MPEAIHLKGMTWDHSRGYDPMVATSEQFARDHLGVTISWEKRSLQAFADRPIDEMAGSYDLMVIDHPHVGEVARNGLLLALDGIGRNSELVELAGQSVGVSHRSYEFDGRQWALAIDAATPVAAFRAEKLESAPTRWEDVVALARTGEVGFALLEINALMTFMGLAQNQGFALAEDDTFIASPHGTQVLEQMAEITALVDPRCLTLDPIGIYEWMGRSEDGPAYSPFGYGYTNYSRDGYCPFPLTFADAPGVGDNGPRGTVIGGTGIAVSASSRHRDVAADYAFWIASADCQKGLFFAAGGQPGNAVAWEDDACNAATRNFFTNTRQTLESAYLRPRYDGYMGFQENAGHIVHAFLRKQASVQATLDDLQRAYQESRS